MLSHCSADQDLVHHTLGCYAYPSSRFLRWTRPATLADLAQGLETELQLRYREASELVLVCHSMGGLVARQYALDCVREGREPLVKRMLLLATPNSGASIAGVGTQIFGGNDHLAMLAPFSEPIEKLNRDWDDHRMADQVVVHYVAGGGDMIVNTPSAKGPANRAQSDILMGFDHRSIVGVKSRKDLNYLMVKRFMLGDPPPAQQAEAIISGQGGDPLFEIYRPEDEHWYLIRAQDGYLCDAAEGGHVWVSGPSGFGKTAALRRRALLSGYKLSQVMLASYGKKDAFSVFGAICTELADQHGLEVVTNWTTTEEVVACFRKVVRKLQGQPAAFLIEEIPLAPGDDYREFLKLIDQLFSALESEQALNVRLMFSSINCPTQDMPIGMPKLRSRLQILPNNPWTLEEISSFVDRLCEVFAKTLDLHSRAEIAVKAEGSPRFVKSLFRRWRNGTVGALSLAELLQSVRDEQI